MKQNNVAAACDAVYAAIGEPVYAALAAFLTHCAGVPGAAGSLFKLPDGVSAVAAFEALKAADWAEVRSAALFAPPGVTPRAYTAELPRGWGAEMRACALSDLEPGAELVVINGHATNTLDVVVDRATIHAVEVASATAITWTIGGVEYLATIHPGAALPSGNVPAGTAEVGAKLTAAEAQRLGFKVAKARG